ncbi:MAG: Hpt domain-containing protein [Nitrosomonadales bacterium]|nr:Hpt domain-containing protein [Nitrosomonadales bacterium]
MSTSMEEFQYLLQGMRSSFLDDLQEHCDQFDNLLLALEKKPDDRALFDELFRGVHNLKGSGGTHDVHIITSICHQLENCLADMVAKSEFSRALERALKYVDLLRRVEAPGRMEKPDYSEVEAELERLRLSALQSRKSCLVAESSAMMSRVYRSVLTERAIRITMVSNGLEALSRLLHEPFDLAIIGRELPDLNGIAVISALRNSQCQNKNMPVVFVTSNSDNIPEHTHIDDVLIKDNRLSANLGGALQKLQL